MDDAKAHELQKLANQLRVEVLDTLYHAQSGHPGGSLSAAEIMTVLYMDQMRVRPDEPRWQARDRFILSKGHAAPMLYVILAHLGYFPKEELSTLRRFGSRLQGHPSALLTPGVDVSTGPLGLGLSYGVGACLAARQKRETYRVYVLMGDGELQEGIVWEAAMSAAKYGLDRLIVTVDNNGVQLDGSNDEIMPLGSIAEKFTAFGWRVMTCDGHDARALSDCYQSACEGDGRPCAVIAKTIKGKGVSFMENTCEWHGKPISEEDRRLAMRELEEVIG